MAEKLHTVIERYSSIVFPGGARERNMAMCSAYFDESSGNGSPVLVVAGFVAGHLRWAEFEREWREILDAFGLRAFHAQHFAWCKKEFRGMQESTRRDLLGRLLDTIQRGAELGFAGVVHVGSFREVFQGKEQVKAGSPYSLACQACVAQVNEWAAKHSQVEPVGYFFDAGNRNEKEVHDSLLQQKNEPTLINPGIGPVVFDSDEVLLPLQAADLAAYELWKWLDEHFSGKQRHGRYPLEEIIKVPWKIREFDENVLLELRARMRGDQIAAPESVEHRIQRLRPGQTD